MGKRTSPKGDASSRAPKTAAITEAERTELLDLAPELDALPDEPVKRRVYAQRSLIAAARKIAAPLFEHTDLAPDALEELERVVSLLERAELAWISARALRANPKLVAARAEGEAYKRLLMRALRYFLRRDEEVQARLTLIAHGTGDADLIDDLRKLAQIAERRIAGMAKAKARLGANPAAKARDLARAIESAGTDRSFDVAATDALDLRNRAFWHAADLESELREAGRYVFEDQPKRLDVFIRAERPAAGDDEESPEEPIEEPEGEEPAGDDPSAKGGSASPKGDPAAPKGDASKPTGAPKKPAKKSK